MKKPCVIGQKPKRKNVHWSSESTTWATPWAFFRSLDAEFHFTLDVCAEAWSAKCSRYYTAEQDGLKSPWTDERCFLNPPYGRGMKGCTPWLVKAASREAAVTVALLPSRTDTKWFHKIVFPLADTIRFVEGRLWFETKNGAVLAAPFPSLVAIFKRL